jgi:cytochrome b involved in lipid metabolism
MNKEKFFVSLSLIIFMVTIFSVLNAGIISGYFFQKKQDDNNNINSDKTDVHAGPIALTEDIVKLHNNIDDCWMIIDKNVYSFSDFLSSHPGGASTMLPYCGKDGTQAFNTKDKNPARGHSTSARQLFSKYLVGPLGKVLTTSQQDKLVSKTTNAIISNKSKLSILPLVTPPTSVILANNSGSSSVSLTTAEIATHNSSQNCWVIINNNVYNVTSFLPSHSGGSGAITPYCGKDATSAFNTKGGGGSHMSGDMNILSAYLIGSVGSSIAVTSTTPSGGGVVATAPTATPTIVANVGGGSIPTATPIPSSGGGGTTTYTASDVATHNTLSNCWIIISGYIYNITSFIARHSGGNVFNGACGTDAIALFSGRHGTGTSQINYLVSNGYRVGSLSSGSNSSPTATPTPVPGGGGGGGAIPTATPTPIRNGGGNNNLPSAVAAKYLGATIIQKETQDNGTVQIKINYNGACRDINLNAQGSITSDKSC